MESLAFSLPLKAGKTEAWRGWVKEVLGPRRREYEAFSRQLYLKLERALDPFTVWLGQWLEDFFDGVDLTQISPGSLSQYVYDIPSVQEDIARSHTLEAMEHLGEISP